MKHFLKTQLVAAPYLASIAFFFYFTEQRPGNLVIAGLFFFLFVSIILTAYVSEARWITIVYSLINFIIDTFLLYFIWLFFLREIIDGNSSVGLLIIITYPITIFELIFGGVIGIAISMDLIEKKNEKLNLNSEVNE
ncbi:hypothetical protein [Paenibacillus antarcticus]|uniref:Uncharacterized protein n=1 Tax=Paenibacillus antarcticus TaxID=253703 RepID=A0A162KEY0_9BACL|nr:hypothetical protein [Paenibacillus antarcticus]OAB45548.1 hypothetical protein PBAT_11520 [Paenibacillus antarcticus]